MLGTVESVKTFKTALVPPTVKAIQGASDGKGGYTLAGVVNPNGTEITDCKFECGPTAPTHAFDAECPPVPLGRDEVQRIYIEPRGQFKLVLPRSDDQQIPGNATPAQVADGTTSAFLDRPLRRNDSVTREGLHSHIRRVTFAGADFEPIKAL